MIELVLNSPARSSWGALLLAVAHPPLMLLLAVAAVALLVVLVVVWLRASWRPPVLALVRSDQGQAWIPALVGGLVVAVVVLFLIVLT